MRKRDMRKVCWKRKINPTQQYLSPNSPLAISHVHYPVRIEPETRTNIQKQSYLEDFGEESVADLLACEIIEPRQVGNGMLQRPARRSGNPTVRRKDQMHVVVATTTGCVLLVHVHWPGNGDRGSSTRSGHTDRTAKKRWHIRSDRPGGLAHVGAGIFAVAAVAPATMHRTCGTTNVSTRYRRWLSHHYYVSIDLETGSWMRVACTQTYEKIWNRKMHQTQYLSSKVMLKLVDKTIKTCFFKQQLRESIGLQNPTELDLSKPKHAEPPFLSFLFPITIERVAGDDRVCPRRRSKMHGEWKDKNDGLACSIL